MSAVTITGLCIALWRVYKEGVPARAARRKRERDDREYLDNL